MTFFKAHVPTEVRGRTSLFCYIDDLAYWEGSTDLKPLEQLFKERPTPSLKPLAQSILQEPQ